MGTERIGSLREPHRRGLSVDAISEPCGPVSGVQAATHRHSSADGARQACEYVAPSPLPPRVSHDTVEVSRVQVQPRVDRKAWTRPRMQRVSRRARQLRASNRRRVYQVLALAAVAALAAAGWVLWCQSGSPTSGDVSAGASSVSAHVVVPVVNNDGRSGTQSTLGPRVSKAAVASRPSQREDVKQAGRASRHAKTVSTSTAASQSATPVAASSRPSVRRAASAAERSLWLE
jgi:hypothetical protein